MTPSEEIRLYQSDRIKWLHASAPRLLELCNAQPWRRQYIRDNCAEWMRDELNRLARKAA